MLYKMTNFVCIVYFLIWTVEMLKRECPTEKKDLFRHMWFSSPGQNSLYTLAGYKYAGTFTFFSQPLYSLRIYASVMNITCKIRHSLRIEKNVKNKDKKCHFKKNIIPPKIFC